MGLVDIKGQKFGMLTVIHRVENRNKRVYWKCLCECGNEVEVESYPLRSGHTRSCGCVSNNKNKTRSSTLSGKYKREYRIYYHMLGRCYNPKDTRFERYSQKGITVCDRWLETFDNFIEDMGPCPEGYSLDRINNGDNYSPKNCRWADKYTQSRNKDNTRNVMYRGESTPVSELAERHGITNAALTKRLKKGMPIEEALSKPLKKGTKRTVTYNGKEVSLKELANEHGLRYGLLYKRIYNQNMSVEEALTMPNRKRKKT